MEAPPPCSLIGVSGPPDNAQKYYSVTSRHPWTRCKLQGFHLGAGPSSSTGHLSSLRGKRPQHKSGNYTTAAGWECGLMQQ